MKLLSLIFCLGLYFTCISQNSSTYEFRDEEELEELEGNGFDHVEAVKSEMGSVSFEEQNEFLIQKLGGKKITFYGMILNSGTYGKKSEQFYDAFRIVNTIGFIRDPDLEGKHEIIRDKDRDILNSKKLAPISFMDHRTPGILLRELEVGDLQSFRALNKYKVFNCTKEMEAAEIMDLFDNSLIINEQAHVGIKRRGLLLLQTPNPDQFSCIVKITGVLEFDGEYLYLDNWRLVEF